MDQMCYYEDELYHHCVKGMKWGVRRYQDKNGRLTAVGKQHLKDRKIDKKIEDYVKSGKAKVDNLRDYEVGALTTIITHTGEKYVSGLMSGHDFDWQEVTNYSDVAPGYHNPAEIIKLKPDAHMTKDPDRIACHNKGLLTQTDLDICNPGYGKPGTTQNCAKCTCNLELALRGYALSAGRQSYPSSIDAASLWFKDAKRVDYDTDFAEEALRSYGKKTSGMIAITYPNGNGGHAMHWSHTSDGEFFIEDGQNGRVFTSVKDMMNTYGADTGVGVTTFRLDNCEPDWDALAQDSVVRLNTSNGLSKVHHKFNDRLVDTW